MKLHRLIAILPIISILGCSDGSDVEPERPDMPIVERFDFSDEINDTRTRFVSPEVEIFYDTPGTLVTRASDGTIEFRELPTGNLITFDPNGDNEGALTSATLAINGSTIELDTCILAAKTAHSRCYAMRPSPTVPFIILSLNK